ncbi:hypothetical protein BDZ45DRAFT_807437 [Acephala macrosclerotiorum]|nr:hypothetical protein BDZ45DRAFT_807437 [Acephala macrosclerotiorum]
MDDNTEDFLPTNWTGKMKKGTKDGKSSIPEVEENDQKKYSSSAPGSPGGDSLIDSMITSVASISVKPEASATVIKSTKSQFAQQSEDVETIKSKTSLVSRLEVPSSLLRKPRSALEDLQVQVASLKQQLEKKEKDLKASKQQTIAAKSEVTTCQKESGRIFEGANIWRLENLELKDKCLQLQTKVAKHTKIVETLEAEHNEELKTQRKQAKKELRLEAAKTKKALSEVQQMTSEEKDQQSTIAQLRKELADKTAGQRVLQTALQKAQEEGNALRDRCTALNSELADLRDELLGERERRSRGSSFEEEDLRRRYADISNQLNQAKQSNAKTGDKIRSLQKENSRLKNELEDAREDLYYANQNENELRMSLRDEESRVKELKKEIKQQKPLVEVGAAVRLRFLEQARESVFELPKSDVNKDLIQDGNIAAHRANGDRDAAMFNSNLVAEEDYDDMKEIFRELYEAKPSNYPCYAPKMTRLTDCEATLKTLKGVSDSKAATNKRKEHGDLAKRLIKMYNSMSDRDFESSNTVRDLLEELEQLIDKIVNIDRPKYGRR